MTLAATHCKETRMEVNLCPSPNIGKASCSVHNKSENTNKEIQAVVKLDQPVTAICPVNGEIQYKTIIPNCSTVETLPTQDHLGVHGGSTNLCEPVKRQLSDPVSSDCVYKKPRKCKLWSQESLDDAMDAVKNGMHVMTAAKQFSVPRTTLKYKLEDSFITMPNPLNTTNTETLDTNSHLKINLHLLGLGLIKNPLISEKIAGNSILKDPIASSAVKNVLKSQQEKTVIQNEKKEVPNNVLKEVKEKRIFKKWSEETMKQAIEAVEKGSKIKDAAILYGVPHSTLGYRLSMKKSNLVMKTKPNKCINIPSVQPELNTVKKSSKKPTFILPVPTIPTMHPTVGRFVSMDTTQLCRSEDTLRHTARCKVAKRKSRGKLKQWTEESMDKALDALQAHEMSVYAAAKKYNVPRSTLKAKKRKRDDINTRYHGPEPHISIEDEEPLVSYVNDCARFGITNIKQVVLLLAAEVAEKQGLWDIKKQGLPSEEWWNAFCLRQFSHIKNVDISPFKKPIRLTKARLSLFYDKLSAVINSSQYHKLPLANCSDCRTFTVQEFQFDMDTVAKLVNEETCTASSTVTDKIVSTICCVSATGNSMPALFVYHTESGYAIPASGLVGPTGALHVTHDSNDKSRNSDVYFKWFSEIFLKYAPHSRPLIVLLDADTSFVTPEFINLAHKNQIILLCLPVFSAHFTQPLNITVLPALQKGFKYASTLFKKAFAKGVNFGNFARCFKVAWNSSVDEESIKSGFAKAGICPFDRKIVNDNELPAV